MNNDPRSSSYYFVGDTLRCELPLPGCHHHGFSEGFLLFGIIGLLQKIKASLCGHFLPGLGFKHPKWYPKPYLHQTSTSVWWQWPTDPRLDEVFEETKRRVYDYMTGSEVGYKQNSQMSQWGFVFGYFRIFFFGWEIRVIEVPSNWWCEETPRGCFNGKLSHSAPEGQGIEVLPEIVTIGYVYRSGTILLMEEIPSNHLGCIKPCK